LTFNFVKIHPFQVENLPSTFFLKTVRLPSVTLYFGRGRDGSIL